MRLLRWVFLACLAAPLPALAGYDEGVAAYRTGDYATALAGLRPLAEQGNAGAQWTVGLMYAQGSGDRAYLRALAGLADRCDNPWRRLVLAERFTSAADARRNGWRVVRGDFEVTKRGLKSPVRVSEGAGTRSTQEQALALLGAIISESGGEASSPGRELSGAEIFVPVAFGEAFRLEVKLRSAWTPAHLEIGLYQGADRVQGYALTYRNATQDDGRTASLELGLRTRNGSQVVRRRAGLAVLADGGWRALVWNRGRDGDMQVDLDGLLLVEARDRGIAGAFDGVRLRNLGGEITVRSLTLYAGG